MNNNYENNICEAIEYIVNHSIAQADFDKTIQCTIIECVDETTGKYKVQYQDSNFYVYSNSIDITYRKGTSVYVLVPKNNMNNIKTIVGSTEILGTDYISTNEIVNSYTKIGNNIIENSSNYELCSYKTAQEIIVFDKTNNINLVGLNQDNAMEYLKQSQSLICGITIKTNIPTEQQYHGNYGIIFELAFADNEAGTTVLKDYTIDIDNINGNPYQLATASSQYGIFDIDGENFQYVNKITLFEYNFPNTASDKDNDIFISNLELIGANIISQEELDTYYLDLKTEDGTVFAIIDPADKALTLQAEVLIGGKVADADTQDIKFYWYRENASILTTSEKYNSYGGRGWECLNDCNLVREATEDTEALVSWVPGNSVFIIQKQDVQSEECAYKCVAICGDNVMSKEVTIKNKSADFSMTITSDAGIQFYYDIGKPNLTCVITSTDEEVNVDDITYIWGVEDYYGSFKILDETTLENLQYDSYLKLYNDLLEKINKEEELPAASEMKLSDYLSNLTKINNKMRVRGNKITSLTVSDIFNYSTYKCTAYYGGNYIGTAAIKLYNSLNKKTGYTLMINNGDQIFNYSTDGVSPAFDSLVSPQEISSLSFDIYDEQGNVLSEEALTECEVQWVVPESNTLLTFEEDETYDKTTLDFSIADVYDSAAYNNQIQLRIVYKDLALVESTHFTFTKQGENGTNGTSLYCRIVPNVANGETIPNYVMVTDTPSGASWNYTPAAQGQYFKVQLYDGSTLLFDGVQTGTIYPEDESKKQKVKVTWSMLRNDYKINSITRHDSTSFSTDGKSTFTYDAFQTECPANIVKATIEYKDVTYYAYYPIITAKVYYDGYYIRPIDNTGFSNVLYNSYGENPQYYNNSPFTIQVNKIINNYLENITEMKTSAYKLLYSWTTLGRIYDGTSDIDDNNWKNSNALVIDSVDNEYCKVKPIEVFDGNSVNNAVQCDVYLDSSKEKIATIHLPVYMSLNQFSNAAINGWDGNSISIDEDGSGVILAPQMGAGVKNEDNTFTGVVMGKVKEYGGITQEGIYGYNHGIQTLKISAEDGSASFGKKGTGQIIIDPETDMAMLYSYAFWKQYDEYDKPINYTEDNYNGQGLLIDLTTPQIRFGNGNFYVGADGIVHARGAVMEGYTTETQVADMISADTAIVATLSNENMSVYTDYTGENGDYDECYSSITVYKGAKDITDDCVYAALPSEGVTGVWTESTHTYQFTNLTGNSGYVDLDVSYEGVQAFVKRVSITKVKAGQPGSKGIKQTDVAYAYADSGTTAPTSGWKSTIEDAAKETTGAYLWTRTTITYTDDTTSVSYSVGKDSKDGTSTYVYVKYSNDNLHFTSNDGNDKGSFMGICTTLSSTAPTDFSAYSWSQRSSYAGLNKWNVDVYTNTQIHDAATIPDISYIAKEEYVTSFLVNDSQSTTWGYGNIMLATVTTYLYSSEAKTVSTQAYTDDGSSFYVNDVLIKKIPTITFTDVTFNLVKGWNKLQFVVNEYTGVEMAYLTLKLSEQSYVKFMSAYEEDKSKVGDQGLDGRGIYSTVVKYIASDDGTNIPAATADWKDSVAAAGVQPGQYLWTKTIVTYTDNTSSDSYSVSKIAEDGINADVVNIAADSQFFKYDEGNAIYTPSTITLVPSFQGDITYGSWRYTLDNGTNWTTVVSGQNGLTITNNKLIIANTCSLFTDDITSISFRCISNNVNYYDTMTIVRLKDGVNYASVGVSSINYDVQQTSVGSALYIRDKKVSASLGRGHSIFRIDPTTLTVVGKQVFDTYANAETQGSAAATYINETSEDYIIAIITADACAVSQTFRTAIASIGGEAEGTWAAARYSHYVIGMKGLGVGMGYEYSQSGSEAILRCTVPVTVGVGIVTNGSQGIDGTSSYSVFLTNESQSIAGTTDAAIATTMTTKLVAYQGTTQKATDIQEITGLPTGITYEVTGDSTTDTTITFTVTSSLTQVSGDINIVFNVDDYSFTKVFSYSLSLAGDKGADAKILSITASSQVFKSTDGGTTFSPDTVTITPKFTNVSFGSWAYSTNGGNTWTSITSTTSSTTAPYYNSSTKVLTVPKGCTLYTDSITAISFRCQDNTSSYSDIVTIVKLYDVTDLEIGGTNLILLTGTSQKAYGGGIGSSATVYKVNDLYTFNASTYADLNFEVGDFVTLSYDWQLVGTVSTTSYVTSIRSELSATPYSYGTVISATGTNSGTTHIENITTSNSSGHVSIVYQIVSAGTTTTAAKARWRVDNLATTDYITISNVKLEKGNKATAWSPCPSDYYTKSETTSAITSGDDGVKSVVKTTYFGVSSSTADTKVMSTSIEQNAESVKIAWNSISQKIQFEVDSSNQASIAIHDADDDLLMKINKDGQTFYDAMENPVVNITYSTETQDTYYRHIEDGDEISNTTLYFIPIYEGNPDPHFGMCLTYPRDDVELNWDKVDVSKIANNTTLIYLNKTKSASGLRIAFFKDSTYLYIRLCNGSTTVSTLYTEVLSTGCSVTDYSSSYGSIKVGTYTDAYATYITTTNTDLQIVLDCFKMFFQFHGAIKHLDFSIAGAESNELSWSKQVEDDDGNVTKEEILASRTITNNDIFGPENMNILDCSDPLILRDGTYVYNPDMTTDGTTCDNIYYTQIAPITTGSMIRAYSKNAGNIGAEEDFLYEYIDLDWYGKQILTWGIESIHLQNDGPTIYNQGIVPYVLYNNPSGNSGTVTWSGHSVADFDVVEIYYLSTSDSGTGYAQNSTRVWQPNGKSAFLETGYVASSDYNIKIASVLLSGTSITKSYGYWEFKAGSGSSTNYIGITRVVGYK